MSCEVNFKGEGIIRPPALSEGNPTAAIAAAFAAASEFAPAVLYIRRFGKAAQA